MKTNILNTLAAVQSVSPLGALTIFAAAFIASYIGLAALLIVAALLAGMHFAKLPTSPVSAVVDSSVSTAAPVAELLPALPSSPIADALANGLQIREIKFAQPTNGRAKVKTV